MLLYSSFADIADSAHWQISEVVPDIYGGEVPKLAAYQQGQLRALIKYGAMAVVAGEYLWYRYARALELPAAPVQLYPLNEDYDYGALIHLISGLELADWLWEADSLTLESKEIDVKTVVQLKALAAWGLRDWHGSIYLVGTTPFVLDCEFFGWIRQRDNLFVQPNPHYIEPSRFDIFVDERQRQLALSTWRSLPSVQIEFPHKPLREMYLHDQAAQLFYTIFPPSDGSPKLVPNRSFIEAMEFSLEEMLAGDLNEKIDQLFQTHQQYLHGPWLDSLIQALCLIELRISNH